MAVKALSEMKVGERGRISKVGGSGQVHRRILDMGVIPPATVEVERIAPLGDPIWIRLRGYQLSLRKEEASNVYVEVD
ncbi:MAG: ferrous iron transport protein A [Dehalococcoidia bacterium]|jgi:Fe2+ transport system protein FeoA|nr:ferrous iron transport protein A [Dehalococcoidia bacterium]